MGPSPGDEGNCASRKPSSVKAQNTAPAMNVAGAPRPSQSSPERALAASKAMPLNSLKKPKAVPRSWDGVAPATIVATGPASLDASTRSAANSTATPNRQKPAVWLMRSESLPTGTPIASRQLWPKPRRLPSLGSVGPATMRRDFGSPRPRCGERSVRLPARRERAPKIARPRYGDQPMLAKLRPAVHHSMTDGGQSRHVGVGEELCDADDRFPLATYGYGLVDQLVSAEVLRGDLSVLLADRLGLAGKQHFGP